MDRIAALMAAHEAAIERRDAEVRRAKDAAYARFQHKVEAARAELMAAIHEVADCDRDPGHRPPVAQP